MNECKLISEARVNTLTDIVVYSTVFISNQNLFFIRFGAVYCKVVARTMSYSANTNDGMTRKMYALSIYPAR